MNILEIIFIIGFVMVFVGGIFILLIALISSICNPSEETDSSIEKYALVGTWILGVGFILIMAMGLVIELCQIL